MHAIKGAWAGQTFALAKCNESEGRKYRTRRSKEEKKTMVESFIKTYQSSNNGNFPSLRLTHKEVGGSFYIIRELVREVIQENRVLGPSKFTPEEQLQNADQFLEQNPLGSISYEPQIALTSSLNGTDFISHHQSDRGEVVATTEELSSEPEHHGLNNGRVVNGSPIGVKSDNASNLRCIELQVSEPSEPTMSFEEETVAAEVKENLIVSEPLDAKESLEDEVDASKAKLNTLVSEPSNAKENLEEQMVASEAKVSPLGSEPSEVKESLPEVMVASEAKVSLLVSEPSEAKEGLQEEMIVSEAKVSLIVSEPSEAKESLTEEVIVSEAKVNPLVREPSEAKESLSEEMIASEAKVSLLESSEAKESITEEMIVSEAKVNPLVREPSEAKESLPEEMVASEAKVSLLESEPSEAKESLEEGMIATEAKVSLLVNEPSEAKESLQEEMIASEAKLNPLVRGPSEAKENLAKGLSVSKAKVDPLSADVIVEVFPVKPITKSTDSLGPRSGEVKVATSTLEKTEVGMDRDALLENSNCPTTKDGMHQSGIGAEVKTINGGSELKSKEAKAAVSNDKAKAQPSSRSKNEATPTLDRMNLKSWEDPSRTPEKNPLVSIFQSFISAFMKLWSE